MVNITKDLLTTLNNLQQMNFIQKPAEATGDLIDNKIADKITKISRNSQQNNSEAVTNKNDKKIPEERYISQKKRQEIIDDLRLI